MATRQRSLENHGAIIPYATIPLMRETRVLPLIDDAEGLAEVSAAAAETGFVGLDTEFVRERTYYPQLCLIQIATENLVACIDPLSPIDLAPLFTVLFRDDCTWVLHSARQDLEVIFNRAGRLPARLVDTQIAGALIGLPAQLGLQGMLSRLLGVELGKTETRTDWSRRPLPTAAVEYAIDDVRYLLPVWGTLRPELEALGRLDWLEEDCARLLAAPVVGDAMSIFERMRGIGALEEPSQAAALALLDWRERKARAVDRPRRWILSDEQLVRIARARPRDATSLAALRDLPKKLVTRSGAEILAAVGREPSPDEVERLRRAALGRQADPGRLKSLQAAVRREAEALDIEPEVLATRRELAALAVGEPPDTLIRGWRAAPIARAAEA